MNSEELELSLRTEFENYLKSALAEIKQEVSDFQEKIDAEFDEQKKRLQEKIESELDEQKANFARVFEEFSGKFDEDKEIEDSFKESVAEHLKLARDEGARITATAIAEAEKMEEEASPDASVNFTDLRDAINEISSKDSQSEILKSLVNHATQYTPRGAFFIVKNEHLVGWRVFGTEEHENPHAIREVFFPISSDTALSDSVKTLETVEAGYGNYEDDSIYLNQLDFGQPEKMYAIPLVARGRGVAVLYADAGSNGSSVSIEALETLVRVAGLTVEVLASSKGAARPQAEHSYESPEQNETAETQTAESESSESYSFAETNESAEADTEDFSNDRQEESFSYQQDFQTEPTEKSEQFEEIQEEPYSIDDSYQDAQTEEEASTGFDFQPAQEDSGEDAFEVSEEESKPSYGEFEWNSSAETTEEAQDFSFDEAQEISSDEIEVEDYAPYEDSEPPAEDYQAETNDSFESDMPVQFDDDLQNEESHFEFQQDASSSASEYQSETPVSNNFDDYSVVEEDSSEESESSFETSYQEESDTSFETGYQEQTPEKAEEPSVQPEPASTAPVRPRFGDRNVDLPIEVTEDERRLHNDARRFARLLVSEIKLYNEQKVKEGRESSDLYERLREAIDRSREMYDKRVQPPVAAKFDYFHYELVNTLAEGEENRLGGSYPGAGA